VIIVLVGYKRQFSLRLMFVATTFVALVIAFYSSIHGDADRTI
jgi:hypothetical protein